MLRVPIIRARPGMELALDVLHPVSGQRLLSRGFPLDAHLIAKLRELRVHEVWVRYPAAEEICRYVAPAVLEHHARLVGLVADLFGSMHSRAHADLDFVPYREALGGMIESLAQHDDAAIYLVEMGGGNGSSLRHAIETCFLSVLLGVRLRDYLVHQRKRLSVGAATDITPLALGALLIDLGMDHIDPTVRARWERTGDEGDPRFREHVQLGYRLLSGRIPPSAAAVVLHHHQRFDGRGFPTRAELDNSAGPPESGLAGREIHVFARIAAVADRFDRLRNPDDGNLVPRVRVLHRMLSRPESSRYDPEVLRALVTVVPAFAPGTIVRLSDGTRVVVTSWHPSHPCRPTVRPVETLDAARGRDTDAIDLRDRSDLRIVEQDGQDVSSDNFTLVNLRAA